MKKAVEISITKEVLLEIVGKKNHKKLKELFPDAFVSEAEKNLEPFEVTVDNTASMITISDSTCHANKAANKCFLLNPEYVWKLIKRYDGKGAYQSYLVPTHHSVHKIRRKRRAVKVAE